MNKEKQEAIKSKYVRADWGPVHLKKQKGITLIALIITIIVILILAGVSTRVAINAGLFDKTKEAVAKNKEQEGKEINRIKKLLDEVPGGKEPQEDSCILNIEVKVPVYNVSLGEFTVVFGIKGIEGENVIYQNVVAGKISSTMPEPISVEIPAKEGTKIEVTALYGGGSYEIAESSKTTILSREETATVSFTDNYNYKMNRNSSSIVSFYDETEYEIQ